MQGCVQGQDPGLYPGRRRVMIFILGCPICVALGVKAAGVLFTACLTILVWLGLHKPKHEEGCECDEHTGS